MRVTRRMGFAPPRRQRHVVLAQLGQRVGGLHVVGVVIGHALQPCDPADRDKLVAMAELMQRSQRRVASTTTRGRSARSANCRGVSVQLRRSFNRWRRRMDSLAHPSHASKMRLGDSISVGGIDGGKSARNLADRAQH